jgi:RND superfamily putative drug exporter
MTKVRALAEVVESAAEESTSPEGARPSDVGRRAFDRLVSVGVLRPRVVCAGGLVLFLLAAGFALLSRSEFPAGGYSVPGSESSAANTLLLQHLDASGMSIVFEITSSGGADSAQARQRGLEIEAGLTRSGKAGQVLSYWTLPTGPLRAAFRSPSGSSALVVAQVNGTDSTAPIEAHRLAERFAGTRSGTSVQVGGQSIVYYQLNEQNLQDVKRVEFIAVPITLLILVWVFGSLFAAVLPILMAVVATVCTIAALKLMASITSVSIFALSVASPLCLALSIDFTLFMINRYREELLAGRSRFQALHVTLRTTGRTITYSAVVVAASLLAVTLFPMYFLRSVGFAAVISVAFSLLSALIFAPALMTLLGPRLDSMDLRRPVRRLFHRPPPRFLEPTETFWYRTARRVMGHPTVAIVVPVGLLLALAVPFADVHLGYPDDRVLPTSASSRQVGDHLRSQYAVGRYDEVQVVMPHINGILPAALVLYEKHLSTTSDVLGVFGPEGTYVGGSAQRQAAPFRTVAGSVGYFVVLDNFRPLSIRADQELDLLKRVRAPASVLFTGVTAEKLDNVAGVTSRVPLVLALIAVTSFALLFLFTGSFILPLKALAMNLLSLTAAFGAMVFIFQSGHLGGFYTTATGMLTVSIPPLVFCVAFGLSMDYEVFMLSRICEEWTRSSNTLEDSNHAVVMGLARTGKLVATAASLMAIVFACLALGKVSYVRMLGVGLTVTVLLDAFLIRLILAPAVMRVAGRFNWWAPGPIKRWHEQHGFSD